MLSNTCKYAIRAVIYLALNQEKQKIIGIKVISEELNIPTPFLSKIFQTLAKNKLLISVKGPNGGFGLGRPASKISLMDIVTIIDGTDFFKSCLIGLKSCATSKKHCPIHATYGPIRDNLQELFKGHTIASLAKELQTSDNRIII